MNMIGKYRVWKKETIEHVSGLALAALFLLGMNASLPAATQAAENLALRKGISFVDDKDGGFPIIADKMDDTTIDSGTPTFIFFGASGDLNANRQAKRVVAVYNKYKGKSIKFIVIDVDHPQNDQAKSLIKKHYKGYIPCQVVLARDGSSAWNKSGEVSEGDINKQIDAQLK